MNIGILFDLDGTLLDTLADLTDATNYALACHGCPTRAIDEVRQFVGNGAERLIRQAVPQDGQTDPMAVLETFRRYYTAHCQIKTKPYDGIPKALRELRRSHAVAIVSNKPDSAVRELSKLYFDGIFARGEDVDCPRKPAPDMVFQAMNAIGVERCIYVGDSEVDIVTAKNADVPCLSVLWGFRDRLVLEAAGASHFCADPAALPDAIAQLEELYGQ